MAYSFLRLFPVFAILGLVAVGAVSAEDCSGTLTAEEAMRAETARYAAQTANDFAAMEQLFGNDLTYNHSSSATDDKRTYIEARRSGRARYRKMSQYSYLKTHA